MLTFFIASKLFAAYTLPKKINAAVRAVATT